MIILIGLGAMSAYLVPACTAPPRPNSPRIFARATELNSLGYSAYVRGEFDEAIGYYREAAELNAGIDNREGLADNYNNLGGVLQAKGDYEGALRLYELALSINEEIGS